MGIKDGGPAFPCTWENDSDMNLSAPNGRVVPPGCTEILQGMTLRDYFATAAIEGMLAHQKRYYPRPGRSQDWHEAIAEEAYELANAMLRAREGHNDDANNMLTALETVLAGGHLTSGEQVIVANAIAMATGRDVADVVKGA